MEKENDMQGFLSCDAVICLAGLGVTFFAPRGGARGTPPQVVYHFDRRLVPASGGLADYAQYLNRHQASVWRLLPRPHGWIMFMEGRMCSQPVFVYGPCC